MANALMDSLTEKSWYKWVCLSLGMCMVGMHIFVMQMLSPLLGYIQADIALSNTQTGVLTSAYAVAGIALPLMVAMLYGKYGIKTVAVAGCVTVLAGLLLFMTASSFWALCAGRLIAGIAASVFNTAPVMIVSAYFRGGKLGSAMGIYSASPPLASFLLLNSLGRIAGGVGWRGTVGVLLGLGTFLLLAVLFLLRLPKEERKQEQNTEQKTPMGKSIWFLAFMAFAFGYSSITYVVFAPRYFVMTGSSASAAAFVTSLYMGLNMFFAPFVGILMDKNKKNKIYLAAASLTGMGVLLALVSAPIPGNLVYGVLLGVVTTAPPVAMFSLFGDILPPDRMAMGPCIISAMMQAGSFAGPIVSGFSLDTGVGFGGVFLPMAVLAFLAAIGVMRIQFWQPAPGNR